MLTDNIYWICLKQQFCLFQSFYWHSQFTSHKQTRSLQSSGSVCMQQTGKQSNLYKSESHCDIAENRNSPIFCVTAIGCWMTDYRPLALKRNEKEIMERPPIILLDSLSIHQRGRIQILQGNYLNPRTLWEGHLNISLVRLFDNTTEWGKVYQLHAVKLKQIVASNISFYLSFYISNVLSQFSCI